MREKPRFVEAGVVRAIYLGRVAGGPMEPIQEANLLAGAGIEGDRYASDMGTFARRRRGKAGAGLALTLIEEESIAAVRREHGIDLHPATTRRNIVTFGVRLEDLVGEEFQLGSALVKGVAVNPPCSRLEKLSNVPGIRKAMTGRGGIRADVLEDGAVRVGDRLIVSRRAGPPG